MIISENIDRKIKMKKTNAEESEKHNSKTNEQIFCKWSIPVRLYRSRLLVSFIGLDTSCQFSEWMEKRLPNEHRFTNSGILLGQLIWIGIGGNGQIELTNISQKRIIYFDNLFSVRWSTLRWRASKIRARWVPLVDDFLHRRDGGDVISSARSNSGLTWIFFQKCNLRHDWALIISWQII